MVGVAVAVGVGVVVGDGVAVVVGDLKERRRTMKTICIYHDNCPDGITALWVVKPVFPEAEPYPGKYDEAPDLERLRGSNVYIVDFSYKLPVLEQIIEVAERVVVIDHHKSAQAELAPLLGRDSRCEVVFDQKRSGALLAWDYFHGAFTWPPKLIEHVSDRDLWRFELQHTREIHAACGLEPLTLEARARLIATPLEQLIEQGKILLRYHAQLVEQAVKYRPSRRVCGHEVPFVPCQVPALISDVGHVLAQGYPFAGVYATKADGSLIVSLRSADDGLDVSEVARRHGGGGHAHAAGFTVENLGSILEN